MGLSGIFLKVANHFPFVILMRTQHIALDTLVCRLQLSQCLLGNLSKCHVLLKQHAGKNLRDSRIFLFLPTYFLLLCRYGMSWHRRAKSVTKTVMQKYRDSNSTVVVKKKKGKKKKVKKILSFERMYPSNCGCNVEVILLLFKYLMICLFYLPL